SWQHKRFKRYWPRKFAPRYATSRNPRNGAAILAVPRLNLLCSCSVKNNPDGTTETLHPDLGDSSHGPHWDYGKYGPGGNRTGRIYPNPNDPGGSCSLESSAWRLRE